MPTLNIWIIPATYRRFEQQAATHHLPVHVYLSEKLIKLLDDAFCQWLHPCRTQLTITGSHLQIALTDTDGNHHE